MSCESVSLCKRGCLLGMLKKRKNLLRKGKHFGALLIDSLTGFDCIDHNILIVYVRSNIEYWMELWRFVFNKPRGVFKTQSNIYNGTFLGN